MQVTVCDRCLRIMTEDPRMVGIDVNGKVTELALCRDCEKMLSKWLHSHHFDGTPLSKRVKGFDALSKPKRKRRSKKAADTSSAPAESKKLVKNEVSPPERRKEVTPPTSKRKKAEAEADGMDALRPPKPKVPSI